MTKLRSQFDVGLRRTWKEWAALLVWAIASLVFLLAVLYSLEWMTDKDAAKCISEGGKPLYEKILIPKTGYVYRLFECKK